MMRLALYQPDIPQNVGTLLRLAACMAITVDIIEPCGFPLSDNKLRRAGMDYIDHVTLVRHSSWEKFCAYREALLPSSRLVLLTTKAITAYTQFIFEPHDILLVGRESAGVPDEVAAYSNAQIVIPMQPPMRSLNVAIAAAMVLGEGLRQIGSL